MTFVTFHEALDYAESVGRRLPTEAEYEFAATAAGTRDFPWGDDVERIDEWEYGPVGSIAYDRTETDPPLFGLFSNVAEWTDSRPIPYPSPLQPQLPAAMFRMLVQGRVIRGGPISVVQGAPNPAEWRRGPRWRHGDDQFNESPRVGFSLRSKREAALSPLGAASDRKRRGSDDHKVVVRTLVHTCGSKSTLRIPWAKRWGTTDRKNSGGRGGTIPRPPEQRLRFSAGCR